MTWQQFVMALWLVWMALAFFRKQAINRDQTSGQAALNIMFGLGEIIGVAVVLHTAGFW